jgi:hypothetical protein
MAQQTRFVCRLNELSFSIYFSLLLVTEEQGCRRGSVFLHWVGYPLTDYLYPVLRRHRIHLYGSHSIALWWLLAVIIVVCVHLLGRLGIPRALVRGASGIVAVAGCPLLLLPPCNITNLLLSTTVWMFLYFEVIVVAVCVLLYLSRRWSAKTTLGLLFLGLHSAIWGWMTWGRIALPFWAVYLFLGLCSSVIWAVYVSQDRGTAKAPIVGTSANPF